MDTELVKDHWSTIDCSADERNFYCFPPIRERSCRMVFGESDSSADWCERHTAEYLKSKLPFDRCVSICCGFGHLERSLAKLHVARHIVGTDIAPGAIEEARRRANGLDIEYYAADLNVAPLPNDEYGLIWANGALHHLDNLESVVSKLHRSLRSDGYLVSTEYVGPKYQQLGTRQLELIDAARRLLPADLRSRTVVYRPFGTSLFARGIRYVARRMDATLHRDPVWKMPPLEFYLATDPSECVSSDRIIPTLKKYFDVEVRGFGGSILYYALDIAFYRNFNSGNQAHREALQRLFDFEDAHLGDLGHDNAHIFCTKTQS